MKKEPYHIFLKSMFGVGFCLLLSILIIFRGVKEKSEFNRVEGKITYINKTYQELPNRHHGKYRYLRIETYPKVFEVFIGNDFGDFRPNYQNIDSLKVGDEVCIFFDENFSKDDPRLNRLVQFIDKNNKPYFIRGTKDKYFGIFFMILCMTIAIWLWYLKGKGKII